MGDRDVGGVDSDCMSGVVVVLCFGGLRGLGRWR